MPGSQVKNWPLYEKLVAQGKDKTTAAKIANASVKKKRPSAQVEVDRLLDTYDPGRKKKR